MGDVQKGVQGKTTVPAMDYESVKVNSLGNTVIGNGNPTTLHVLTFGQAGTTWVVDIFKITAAGVSAGISSINPAVQGTFGYNIFARKGFIINSKSAIAVGDLTVAFREE